MIYFCLGLLLAYFGGCYLLAKSYLSPARILVDRPAGVQDIQIGTIPTWHAVPEKANQQAVFIFAHGYGGCRGQWAEIMPRLAQQGYESFAPAMPGHDASPDPSPGFGRKEAATVVNVIQDVRKKNPQAQIILVGVSMGGAACWLASEEEPEVAAVVTEGAFARLDPTVNRWFDLVLPGGHTLLAPVKWMTSRMSGVDPASVNPVEAAKKWQGKPALIIHCEADKLMPEYNATALSGAAACSIWHIPNSHHAHGCADALEDYSSRLVKLAQSLSSGLDPKGREAQSEGQSPG